MCWVAAILVPFRHLLLWLDDMLTAFRAVSELVDLQSDVLIAQAEYACPRFELILR